MSEKKSSFDRRKTAFFFKIGAKSLDAFKLHEEQGLLARGGDRKRPWGNVTEHCLVEAARVEVFADLLKLPPDLKADLGLAAVAHDFYKKSEIEKLRANNTSWEAYAEAQVKAKAIMDASRLNKRVTYLATAVGHETLGQAEAILAKPVLEPVDIAWLTMHYVDDYTINAEWVVPASEKDGELQNDFHRRMDVNRGKAHPGGQYYGINKAGMKYLGEPTYDAQERVGSMVEAKLAQLVSGATGQEILPALLPEFIDQQIAAKIA